MYKKRLNNMERDIINYRNELFYLKITWVSLYCEAIKPDKSKKQSIAQRDFFRKSILNLNIFFKKSSLK